LTLFPTFFGKWVLPHWSLVGKAHEHSFMRTGQRSPVLMLPAGEPSCLSAVLPEGCCEWALRHLFMWLRYAEIRALGHHN